MPQYELNLRDYWRIIKKKKIIVIVTIIMLGGFSMIFAIMNKPTPLYQASSSLKIERQTNLMGLYLANISWGEGDDLATRSEIIKSYPMIEKTAQAMGLIDSSLSSDEIRSNPKYFAIVSRLKSRVKTEQEGYTNIINITTTSYDPQEAYILANALAKVYSEESFREKNAQTTQALNAIRTQLEKAESSLRASERNVQIYRERNRFITLDGAASRLTGQLDANEVKLEKIRADIVQVDNIISEIQRNPDYIYYSAFSFLLNTPNRALETLQASLNQQRTTYNNYLQYYTPQHPIIKDLQRQIQTSEKRFMQELYSFRQTLIRTERVTKETYEKTDQEYKSLPLLGLTLSNLERELQIKTQIYQELEIRYQEALIKMSEQVQEVFIIRPAFLPNEPINPTMIGPTTAIGIIIGLILGIVLAFVAETLDTTFSTIDDIEKTLDTTVLGIIPYVDIENIKSKLLEKITTEVPDEILQMQARLVSHYNPKSTMAEAFRGLRTNVHFGLLDKGYKSVMVTSSVAGEGKTTVSVNLAVSLAQIGLNTLLVETDLRKPRVSKLFGIDKEPGLTDVILRKEPLDGVIRTMSDLMMGTMATDTFRTDNIPGIEYLNILTCGRIERNPSEIIASKLMDTVISELKERYDIILFDSAPVIQATDSTVLGSKVDTVILVYYQGKISRGTLRRSKNQLEMLKSDILGVVLNGMKADVSADYADYKYSYDYHYSYGESAEPIKQNRVLAFLQSFFLNEKEGLMLGIFHRLRKGRILAAILALASVFFLGYLGIHAIKSHRKPAAKVTSEVTLPVQTKAIAPDSILTDTTVVEETDTIEARTVPAELKALQERYGIEPLPDMPKKTTKEKPVSQIPSKQETSQTVESPKPMPPITTAVPPKSQLTVVPYTEGTAQIIKISKPFTVLLKTETIFSEARKVADKYNKRGLRTFLSFSYPNPETEMYLICTGRYANEELAKKQMDRLIYSGQNTKAEVISLDYSILMGKYATEQGANQAREKYSKLRYFLQIVQMKDEPSGAQKYFLLIGGFRSEAIADLFFVTRQDLFRP
ncbi:MAG: polysaccharide biosynthesis tyrosine autokinase [Candidatus Neomarinimicrobiota bacterium]